MLVMSWQDAVAERFQDILIECSGLIRFLCWMNGLINGGWMNGWMDESLISLSQASA